jgi:hypothetical protein
MSQVVPSGRPGVGGPGALAVGGSRAALGEWLAAVAPDSDAVPVDVVAVDREAGDAPSGAGRPRGAAPAPGAAGSAPRQAFAAAAVAAAAEAATAQLEAGRVVPATVEGLAAGGERARGVAAAGLAEETRVRQTAVLGEVLAYFSGVGVSAAYLEPDDLVSYVMDHWLEAHPGRGGGLASPASVDSLFGNLSGALARCGRVGPYQPVTGVGNPVDSVVVADFKAGFRQQALAGGGRRAVQLGAVPFVEERVRELVRGSRARAMELLRRDPDCGGFEVARARGLEAESVRWLWCRVADRVSCICACAAGGRVSAGRVRLVRHVGHVLAGPRLRAAAAEQLRPRGRAYVVHGVGGSAAEAVAHAVSGATGDENAPWCLELGTWNLDLQGMRDRI